MTKGVFLRTLFEENNTILKWCISAPLYQLIAIIDGADTLAC